MDALTIDRSAFDAIMAHARETHPEECCGAIIARGDADVVHRFTNIQSRLHAEDPEHNPRDGTRGYTPEPKELLAVLHAGEEPGARLVAFYHSHPITGAYFSGEDRARAMFGDEPSYPDVTYVVVSDARIEGEVRAFIWDEATQDFVERPLRVRERVVVTPRSAKKAAVGKPAAKKRPTKKTVAKKRAARKVPAQKKLAKRKPAKQGSAKQGPARKVGARKTVVRKVAGRKATSREVGARTMPARKTVPRRGGPAKKAAPPSRAAKRARTKKK